MISFTFDDFPRSALLTGGAILKRFGLVGTYYASLGLLDSDAPTGRIFCRADLTRLLEEGHELGCHTFSHCHSWDTNVAKFEASVIENREALHKLCPGAEFKTLSFPISPPHPLTKSRIARHFICCRGGGQSINLGTVDLNHLAAFFLEKSRDHIQAIRDVIDRNRQTGGWLILATHDISDTPTPYGCTPQCFENVVKHAVESGARILPVAGALEAFGYSNS